MAVTRCDMTILQGRVIAALNAAAPGTWSTTVSASDDGRRNTTEIQKAILGADAQVCLAVCETLGHGYRTLFLADSADLTYGAVIPDHLGPPEQVMIKFASIDGDYHPGFTDGGLSLADLDRWRANPGSVYGSTAHAVTNSPLAGFYLVLGAQIFFTGHVARMKLANFTRTSIPQAPEAYEDALFALAVSNLVKEGDSAPYLQAFLSEGNNYLAMIRGGMMAIPPLQVAQAA